MTSHETNIIELSSGATLFMNGEVWCARQPYGEVHTLSERPIAALLLLEQSPKDFVGRLGTFPLNQLLTLALSSKNVRFINQALSWIGAFDLVDQFRKDLSDLLPFIPKSAQRTRQKIQLFLSR